MRITSKGQVTIPLEVRKRLGIRANSDVEFHVEGERAYLVPVVDAGAVADKIEAYRGAADTGFSTEDILALTRKRA